MFCSSKVQVCFSTCNSVSKYCLCACLHPHLSMNDLHKPVNLQWCTLQLHHLLYPGVAVFLMESHCTASWQGQDTTGTGLPWKQYGLPGEPKFSAFHNTKLGLGHLNSEWHLLCTWTYAHKVALIRTILPLLLFPHIATSGIEMPSEMPSEMPLEIAFSAFFIPGIWVFG